MQPRINNLAQTIPGARHYGEGQLGALVISIATINTFNRIDAATRQIIGEWVEQVIRTEPARRAA